jgi:hypothetical protein
MNGPKKQECYITVGWRGLPGTNTLACLAHLWVTKKMRCCECTPWNNICYTSFYLLRTNGPNKLECYITVEWRGLFGLFISSEENEALLMWLVALSENIILGWKVLPAANTLAYLSRVSTKKVFFNNDKCKSMTLLFVPPATIYHRRYFFC